MSSVSDWCEWGVKHLKWVQPVRCHRSYSEIGSGAWTSEGSTERRCRSFTFKRADVGGSEGLIRVLLDYQARPTGTGRPRCRECSGSQGELGERFQGRRHLDDRAEPVASAHGLQISASLFYDWIWDDKQHVCLLIISSCIADPSVVCSVIQMIHL